MNETLKIHSAWANSTNHAKRHWVRRPGITFNKFVPPSVGQPPPPAKSNNKVVCQIHYFLGPSLLWYANVGTVGRGDRKDAIMLVSVCVFCIARRECNVEMTKRVAEGSLGRLIDQKMLNEKFILGEEKHEKLLVREWYITLMDIMLIHVFSPSSIQQIITQLLFLLEQQREVLLQLQLLFSVRCFPFAFNTSFYLSASLSS